MFKNKQIITVLFLVFFAANAFSQVISNQMAPDFTVTDTKGQKRSLSDYKGKFVVLEWFNPDCPFVQKHYFSGNMPKLQKIYTAKGVIWLSLNVNSSQNGESLSPAGLDKFMQLQGGAPTAVIIDKDGKIAHLYDAQTTPGMYIIDPKGILIYQGAIDSIPSANFDDIKKASNYVSDALDAAMNGKPVAVSATKSYGCSVKF